MRFGMCYSPDQTPALAEAGYDFVEWPMSRTVGEMDEDAYRALRTLAQGLTIRPEAWNVMLPRSIKVVGPDADHAAMERYVETAFSRAAELGGQVVVFGSGGSRAVPDGWAREEAMQQFDDACRLAGDVAARNGITIAIEPLNRAETNLINSVSEAAVVVGRLGHSSVRLLSDLYHVAQEDEPFNDTGAAASLLAHVHIAAPYSRLMPRAGEMDTMYREFFRVLTRSGYDDRISIECSQPTLDEAADGLTYLKHLWEGVTNDVPA